MIIEETDILERVSSPNNLLNRLKRETSIGRNSHPTTIPCIPPTANDVIEDLDEKLALGSLRSRAAKILNSAMAELEVRMPEVQKPEKLASIAEQMAKVIKDSNNNGGDIKAGQIIVYAPRVVTEDVFDVVDISR